MLYTSINYNKRQALVHSTIRCFCADCQYLQKMEHDGLLNTSPISVLDACDVTEHLGIHTFPLPS